MFIPADCFKCCGGICWVKWQSSTARSAVGFFETRGGRINIQLNSDGPVFLASNDNFGPDERWLCECKPSLQACGKSLFLSNSQGGLRQDSSNKTYSISLDKPVSRIVLPIFSLGRISTQAEYTFSQSLKMVKRECPVGDEGSTLGLTVSANKVTGTGQSSVLELDGNGPYTAFSFHTGFTSEFYALVHIGVPCCTPANPLP